MQVVHSSKNYKAVKNSVTTMGNFDGVHIAHKEIIRRLTADARKYDISSLLYTFNPHPAKVFNPQTGIKLIQTQEQKLQTLEQLGLNLCIIEKFDEHLYNLNPESFFKNIVLEILKPKKLIIGYNFTFGKKRSGNTELLEKLCGGSNIEFELVNPIFADDILISSTQVRNFIQNGRVSLVKDLLGRNYTISGTIIKGRGRGSKLGIHTANLATQNELVPKNGVYITKTRIKDKSWPSVTNVGINPTFNDNQLSIETHIFNFNETLYNEKIEIEFIKFHRDEIRFGSVDELAKQIGKDIKEARFYYEKTKD